MVHDNVFYMIMNPPIARKRGQTFDSSSGESHEPPSVHSVLIWLPVIITFNYSELDLLYICLVYMESDI